MTLGADPAAAVAAVSRVDEVAGRYRTVQIGRAHRANAAGEESGRLAGGAVDGGHVTPRVW